MNIIKYIFTIAFAFLFTNISFSQTEIPAGNVSGNWTVADSPFKINGEITIKNGETLTIDPGVTIEFQGYYKFNVQGKLLAVGNISDTGRIHFTDTYENVAIYCKKHSTRYLAN